MVYSPKKGTSSLASTVLVGSLFGLTSTAVQLTHPVRTANLEPNPHSIHLCTCSDLGSMSPRRLVHQFH